MNIAKLTGGGALKPASGKCHWVALTRVNLVSLLLAAMLTCGEFGRGRSGTLRKLVSPCKIMNVFRAAPFNVTRSPLILQSMQLSAPPAYVTSIASTTHPRQFMPSSACVITFPITVIPLTGDIWRGGTCGSTPSSNIAVPATKGWGFSAAGGLWGAALVWAKSDCVTVDVWDPKKYIQQAPNTNDPNASVTLDITRPPSGKSNCTIWRWHSEAPPPKTGGAKKKGKRKDYTPVPNNSSTFRT